MGVAERFHEEISVLRLKLESIDTNIKSVVASAEEIETTLLAMERMAADYTNQISFSLKDLGAMFTWGVAEIVFHLELQQKELKRIIEILEAPLETKAKELRRRAEFAYRNGWVDEALADFLEAEKANYADFTVHQALGNIYLTKNLLSKAEEYYKKAAKYARPHSKYYTAYALWHLSHVKFLQGEINAAYEATKEAIQLEPRLIQAVYDHSRYCALLNKAQECLEHLKSAIEADRNYALKALTEEAFGNIRTEVNKLLESLRKEARDRVEEALQTFNKLLEIIETIDVTFKWCDFKKELKTIQIAAGNGSYFSLLDIEKYLANRLWNSLLDRVENQIKILSERVHDLENRIPALERSMNESITDWELSVVGRTWLVLAPIAGSICGFFQWKTSGSLALGVITGVVFAIFGPAALGSFLIALLFSPLGERRIRKKYQLLIQSCSQERQALDSKIRQLNDVCTRIKAFCLEAPSRKNDEKGHGGKYPNLKLGTY